MDAAADDRAPGPVVGWVRAPGYVRLGTGLHQPVALGDDHAAVLRAWQLVLPEAACFTGVTAALLRGWWLPALPPDVPVFVAQRKGVTLTCRPQVRVSRHAASPAWVEIGGVRVAAVAEVLLACARDLCLLDLVVLLDGVLHDDPSSRPEIEEAALARRRGAPRLRDALALSDSRSESPWESMLRVLLVVCDVGVEPQHELLTGAGGFVARADLWLVGTTTLMEYDGSDHLERARQRTDLRRLRRVSRQRWTRHGYTDDDVLHRAVTILRDADAATGREHDPSRIRAWHALVRESARTPAGRARLRSRWGLPTDPPGESVA